MNLQKLTTMLMLMGFLLLPTLAIAQEATPEAAGIQRETLFEVVISGNQMPENIAVIILFSPTILDGVELEYPEGYSAPYSMIAYVDSGELLVGPLTDALAWQGGTDDTVRPGTIIAGDELLLEEGAVYFQPKLPVDEFGDQAMGGISNPGTEPNAIIGVWIRTIDQLHNFLPIGLGLSGRSAFSDEDLLSELVGQETMFRLTRTSIEPGGVIDPLDGPLFSSYLVESGSVDYVLTPEDKNTQPMRLVWPEGSGGALSPIEGVVQTVENSSEEATVVLELVVIPTTSAQSATSPAARISSRNVPGK